MDIGEGVVVSGLVRSAQDCSALANADVEHWQTDGAGRYTERMRGRLATGADGRFRFETDWPGAPLPHIHFIVTAPGHQRLVTQWVGDEPTDRIELDLVLERID